MIKIQYLFFFLLLFSLIGCKTYSTKLEKYPELYSQKMTSILIAPPTNESTASDAKEYYSTTIFEPLVNKGYYVIPYPVSSILLSKEGIYDAEILDVEAIQEIGKYYGVDAIFFTKITEWDLSYTVVASSLTVSFEAVLVSTENGSNLWEYKGRVRQELTEVNHGLLINMLITAVNAASSDYVPYAKAANLQMLTPLPYGKYHPRYQLDQSDEFVDIESL